MNQNSNPTGNPRVHITTTSVRVPGAGAEKHSGDLPRSDNVDDRDEHLSIALDPETALRGLLATKPPADEDEDEDR